jgi:hypothetical protein
MGVALTQKACYTATKVFKISSAIPHLFPEKADEQLMVEKY